MTKSTPNLSDLNASPEGTGCRQIAKEFDIPEDQLANRMAHARSLLEQLNEHVRSSDKKALKGLGKKLADVQATLAPPGTRERLAIALAYDALPPNADDLARYVADHDARAKLAHALQSLEVLIAIIKVGEKYSTADGRPDSDGLITVVAVFVAFWTEDLQRKGTISGHPDDPRGVKPSLLLQFVHRCMQELGVELSQQTCRTLLKNLSEMTGKRLQGTRDAMIKKHETSKRQ